MDEEITGKETANVLDKEEEIADAIIERCGGARAGIYSERQMMRKMRDERSHLPKVAEIAHQPIVAEYILEKLTDRLLRESGLSRLERRMCILLLEGYSRLQAAGMLGISRQRGQQLFLRIRAVIEARPRRDPYHGLYEVYWQEVNRHVYRKPRLEWT